MEGELEQSVAHGELKRVEELLGEHAEQCRVAPWLVGCSWKRVGKLLKPETLLDCCATSKW